VVVWHAAGDAGTDSIGNEPEVSHAHDRLAIAVVEMVLARGAVKRRGYGNRCVGLVWRERGTANYVV
jgi:hypothetical protein